MAGRPALRRAAALVALALVLAPVWGCHRASGSAMPAQLDTSSPAAGVGARSLGLVVNEADPLSAQAGDYYRRRREIPEQNVVRVRIPHPGPVLSLEEFRRIKRQVDKVLGSGVQALALAWREPFRVECMSITSAFATGFDPVYCASGCRKTPHSAYFDSDSRMPFTDFGVRPAMLLAAARWEDARALIDRGADSDGTVPAGTAYLLDTSDRARDVRAPTFHLVNLLAGGGLNVEIIHANSISHRSDVLFYFTGITEVSDLTTNRFLPGALADHLTSFGGILGGAGQMSSLKWLEAGATASYGTVVEPCSFPEKFPNVPVLMRHYLSGETAIESYWKSVEMPSQGVFIGEPLAAPYDITRRKLRSASR